MRRLSCLLIFVAACGSAWDQHHTRLAEHEASGAYAGAIAEQRWLIDNAFYEAPSAERSDAAEAKRYLHLAELAGKSGNVRLAVQALREALTTDPDQAAAIRAQLDRLPLSPADAERLKREFAWNSAALAPNGDLSTGATETQCWSYNIREVRIRHRRTVNAPEGMQRQVTYDARPWRFDAETGQWRAEGNWVVDAGTEVELIAGPSQPRYRAVTAADHEFYADGNVPPCHRAGWQGPYDASGTLFVAEQLPVTSPVNH
jgi:hypothetical protein